MASTVLLQRRARRWFAALALWVLAPSVAAGTDPAASLIDKVIGVYGGEGAPAALRQIGVTHSELRGTGQLTRALSGFDRLRIEIRYPAGQETRILRGAEAWQGSRPMNPAFKDALTLQAARLALPWNLLAAREHVRELEPVIGPVGRQLRSLALPIGEGMTLIVDVDPETGYIVRTRSLISGNSGRMEFATEYRDFRRKDGRLYAATEQHYALGRHMGHSHIDSVEFEPALPDSLFRPEPPDGAREI